jgi:iron(III) transport system ATP-binding protein
VTHDQSEALVMSSRIAVMNKGIIEQVGKPREIYANPASRFVAEFIGTSNFVNGVVASVHGAGDEREIAVDTVEGRVVSRGSHLSPAVGADVLLSIRPECVDVFLDARPGAVNAWQGEVLTRAFLGDAVDHVVGVSKMELRTRSNPTLSIAPGTRVHLTVDPAKVTLVPAG